VIRELIMFAIVALLLLFAVHRYIWARTLRDTALPRAWKWAGTFAIIVLGLAIPATILIGRRRLDATEIGLARTAYVWLGFAFYALLAFAVIDLVRGLQWMGGFAARMRARRERSPASAPERAADVAPADPSRRVFMARAAAGIGVAASGSIVAIGHRSAMGEIATPEIPVKLARLPRALSGYRIVQLTDLHLGPILRADFLESIVEKANASRPDLVAITGDLVDAPPVVLGRELAPLAKLRARHGVVFVTGNHEYYCGAAAWVDYLREHGIRVLMNERIALGDGASFDLAGIPDRHGGSYIVEHTPDLSRALDGRDPDRELVLLAHQPVQIEMAEGKGVGLQISGHTHGGQMWPFGALVALAQPYVSGFHRHRDGTQIYVSRGAGFWGPPMRVAEPAEIASIVLVSD
jgi:predicted MPP superfamily phosphohydrolase